MTKTTIRFYDCTLRDGAQGPGINFSLSDKVRLARALDDFGVDYVEGGWPGANPKDTAFFQRLRKAPLKHAVLTAFGATRRPGCAVAEDAQVQALLDSGAPVVALVGKASSMHVRQVLRTTLKENLAMVGETVRHLKAQGRRVVFEAEHFFDGHGEDAAYALAVLRAAAEAGAECVVLCDTNGATLPYDLNRMTAAARKALPAEVTLGIHCHNDADCAVAGSLLAIRAGATLVQGTVNGFGERCGNANLCSIMPAVALKMPGYAIPEALRLAQLTDLSRLFYELAVVRPIPQQPYVGTGAFAHKGGMHANAVAKDSRTFEHIPPAAVGNRRDFLLSEQAGAASVVLKAREQDLDLAGKKAQTQAILKELKEKEARGYSYEAADASFKLLVQRMLEGRQPPFAFEGFRVIVEKRGPAEKTLSEATIKVRVNGHTELTAAESDGGPVNALDMALRKALSRFFPQVAEMQLRDFKVRIIDGTLGTAAQTRVLVDSADRSRQWSTVGVSENIIEASWQALLDSVEYYLELKEP